MADPIVQSQDGVTLVGGGPVSARALTGAMRLAPQLVAADGGANRLLRLGQVPEAVIGDLDSISNAARGAFSDRLYPISEQETTDFDKALRSIAAPFVLGLGFSGARLDHGLAVLNALARHSGRRCVILDGQNLTFLALPVTRLRLPVGTRLSLFPLGDVSGQSAGLRWPIGGLQFSPHGLIGTSNEVSDPMVRLEFDAPRMLVILPAGHLRAVLRGLGVQRSARGE